MKRSNERILTTHTGSLPRPDGLRSLLLDRDAGKHIDEAAFQSAAKQAVNGAVKQQLEAGLSVVNDGEQSKNGFASYVRDRLSGLEGEYGAPIRDMDARRFPDWADRAPVARRLLGTGPVAWKRFEAVEQDIVNLTAATAGLDVDDVFMTAVSPGSFVNFHDNRSYATTEAYCEAVVGVMQREYEAIVGAGFILQLDCPDLALHDIWFPDLSVDEFRGVVARNVELLNAAIANIPADRVRIHVCWGAGERPHHRDVPLHAIIDLVLGAHVGAYSIVGANGRHEHEWNVWRDVKLPDGKLLIPGVIDNTTNIVEHPEVVAARIVRYAQVVGRENVIAGVDCGFGTTVRAAAPAVVTGVVWAKLAALAEGARLATRTLWGQDRA